jgi:hypothetical protein
LATNHIASAFNTHYWQFSQSFTAHGFAPRVSLVHSTFLAGAAGATGVGAAGATGVGAAGVTS